MTIGPSLTLADVAGMLRPLGVRIESRPGEYWLSYRQNPRREGRLAETLAEALEIGRQMAGEAPCEPPPLGPTGRRRSRKGTMYRHNARIAARRAKALARAAESGNRGKRHRPGEGRP